MKIKILMPIIFIMLVSCLLAQVPQMVEGWPYLTRTDIWAVYSIPRFSFNEYLDSGAIFFNNITCEIDKFHIDGSFYSGWPVIQDSVLFGCPPVLVDVDGDGVIELVPNCPGAPVKIFKLDTDSIADYKNRDAE